MLNFDRNIVFILILALLGASVMILQPFFSALFWAGILAFATWPLMKGLTKILGGRVTLSAAILSSAWILLVAVPVLLLGFNLADHVRSVFTLLREVWVEGLPPAPAWMQGVPFAGDYLVDGWHRLDQESAALATAVKPHLGQIGNWLAAKSAKVGGGLLELALSLILVFFFYRDGPAIVDFVRNGLTKLIGDKSQHYLDLISGTVQSVLNGVIGTALAQAVLALIGFWIAGVPGAVVLGVLTFFLSFLPAAPPLVWLPVVGWLVFKESYGYAAFMAIWGFFVISGVDNILKPYLISRGGSLPLVIVLLAIGGGIWTMGILGLVLGPVILAISYSLAREWASKSA